MDILVNLLCKYNFSRVSSRLEQPVVIHCVPGAGKSSLIRELIRQDNRFVAYTAGIPDEPDLSGCWIKKWEGSIPSGKLLLLDEYTLLDSLPEAFAVFGDPVQLNSTVVREAHFTCNISRRFGTSTGQLLRELGWDIQAEGPDLVQVSNIFTVEPVGTVIYFEEEVGCLLRRHGVKAKSLAEIRGQTFTTVTFVTSESSPLISRVSAYQCLTRHREALYILNPDATYTSA